MCASPLLGPIGTLKLLTHFFLLKVFLDISYLLRLGLSRMLADGLILERSLRKYWRVSYRCEMHLLGDNTAHWLVESLMQSLAVTLLLALSRFKMKQSWA